MTESNNNFAHSEVDIPEGKHAVLDALEALENALPPQYPLS